MEILRREHFIDIRFRGNNFQVDSNSQKIVFLMKDILNREREREGEILSPITFIELLEREDTAVAGTIEDYDSIDHLERRN